MLARLSTALPSQCAVCHAWQDRALCALCVQRFGQPEPRCMRCALPLTGGATLCGDCVRQPPPLDACCCAVNYAYPWSDCIAAFKFREQAGWASTLADLMRRAPGVSTMLADSQLVLPMPLSAARLRARGFNQAHELARRLAPDRHDAHLLLRLRDTAPQWTLKPAARARNLHGALALEPLQAHRVRGMAVTLVDDVMTSGASLWSAATVLRQAGATRVSAVVFARTPKH